GILLVIGAISYFIVPQMMSRQVASEGASQLQGWLFIAQQRARRDQAPRGIRLNLGQSGNPQYVTEHQYIEQPDDYYVNGAQIPALTGTTVTIPGGGLDFYGGNGASDPPVWLVQVGDYLLVNGGPPHQITAVSNTTLTLSPVAGTTIGAAVTAGSNVQIQVA